MSESSPEVAAEAVATTSETTEVSTQNSDVSTRSESSPEPAGSMLDAVKTALEPKEASPASQEPGPTAEAETQEPTTEDAPEDEQLSPEELKALSQKTQRRFQGLTSKVKAKDRELEALKPKAAEFEKIERFVTQAGMTNDDVGFFLTVGALSKGQPEKALEQLRPFMAQLERQVGEVLPADLQERVRLGYITEADARELSKATAGRDLATKRADEEATRRREEAEQREQTETIKRSLAAAETWEKARAAKDPDWHLKRDEVADTVKLAILEQTQAKGGRWFPSDKEVIEISTKALEKVNKRFKSRIPNPSEIRPVNPGGAPPRTTPKPSSMLDVVKNAVA